jgi:hypothetical protein
MFMPGLSETPSSSWSLQCSPVRSEVHESHDVVPLDLSCHKHLIMVQGAVVGEVWPLGTKQERVLLCLVVPAMPVGSATVQDRPAMTLWVVRLLYWIWAYVLCW